MDNKKTIIEEALLDIDTIKSALNANTKEILRSVAKEEIDGIVKESLIREDFEEEDIESDSEEKEVEPIGDTEETPELGGESELGDDTNDEMLDDVEGSVEMDGEMTPELGMDALASDGAEMDMTAASDDDVIAIYKKLSGEDEIEIVGDDIHLSVSEPGDYIIKTNDTDLGDEMSMDEPMGDVDLDSEMSMDEPMGDESDDVDYEIELDDAESDGGVDDESIPDDLVPVDDEEGEEEEKISETLAVTRGFAGKQGAKMSGSAHNPKALNEAVTKYNNLLTEAKKLKSENEQFREALKVFRKQLVETVVFNSNLSYVTKLFTEYATTKSEKESIINRFDNEVSSLTESQKLYKSIVSELSNRKPITESITKKITQDLSTGTSKLTEATVYADPSTKRIIELMERVERHDNKIIK